MSKSPSRKLLAGLALAMAASGFADFEETKVLPWDDPAIRYEEGPVSDPVADLQQRLSDGKVPMKYDEEHGFLRSLLKALDVPQSSQVLVFAKTSFQAPRISPRMPRALYFSDQVFVGWVQGGDVLEIASVDPRQGVVFYTMEQDPEAKPRIDRRNECLQCHASTGTLGVPGLVVRSVFVDRNGAPQFQAGGYVTDHRSPLSHRWGGWYVTGTHGSQRHMGNVTIEDRGHPDQLDHENGANVTDLKGRLDTGRYLTPWSDIVALMTLEHQTRMTNLITRVGYATRMGLEERDAAIEELLKYLLFVDETPLEAPIKGTSDFTAEFAARGPRDHRGRSLRDFDLTRRMFRYPCSFLIDSPQFAALPPAARDRIYRRLWEVLTGADRSPVFAKLTAADRTAVYEILADTKRDLPEYWRAPRTP